MIGYIEGRVIFVNVLEGSACIFANGIGHLVAVGGRLSQNILPNQEISLYIETIVKEDSISLYGFSSFEKRLWFASLLKVSGVGAKVAMAVLDAFSPQEISNTIVANQAKVFQSVSGLGEKVSQRITAELQNQVQKNMKILSATKLLHEEQIAYNVPVNEDGEVIQKPKKSKESKDSTLNINDVTSALCNLGFDFNRSFEVASKAVKTCTTLEEAIKNALSQITS